MRNNINNRFNKKDNTMENPFTLFEIEKIVSEKNNYYDFNEMRRDNLVEEILDNR